MSDRLRKQVDVELAQLRQLLTSYGDLLARCGGDAPSFIEVSALAALLHSFYNGVENIFKRIVLNIDAQTLNADSWHRDLLDQVSQPASRRSSVISESLRLRLAEYFAFRHVFRGSYIMNLRWEKMRPLVIGCPSVLAAFEIEIEEFLRRSE